MSFILEVTSTDKTQLQLRIVKKSIAVYVIGDCDIDRNNLFQVWCALEVRSRDSIPHSTQWRRGDEQTHLEEEHSSEEELQLDHSHSAFSKQVDPEIFASYLNGIFNEYQKLSSFNKDKIELSAVIINRLIAQFSTDFYTYRLDKTPSMNVAINPNMKENMGNVAETRLDGTKKPASKSLPFQFWGSLKSKFKRSPSENSSCYDEKRQSVNAGNAL